MSLGQMLAVCKTLSGIADNGGRYQMKQENLLPKFEPAKRFEPAKSEALSQPERPQPVFVPPAPARTADAQRKDSNMKTAVTEGAEPEAARFPLGRWSKNPFVRRAALKAGAPAQGELSLEGVKVVRNDLSDADLEVVAPPATVAGETPFAAPQAADASAKEPAVSPWSKIAARLFGTGGA